MTQMSIEMNQEKKQNEIDEAEAEAVKNADPSPEDAVSEPAADATPSLPTPEQKDVEDPVDALPSAEEWATTQDELATSKVEVLALQSEVTRLAATLHEQQTRLDDTLRAFRKSQEEFERKKDRLIRESETSLTREKARVLEPLLEVADNLHLSLTSSQNTPSFEGLFQGVEMVLEQFKKSLVDAGLTPIDPKGEGFQPDSHEAMGVVQVDTEEDDNKIIEVLRLGYKAGDMVIRPALVQVGRFEKS